MKTLVVNKNKIVSILTMFALLVLATVPAMATEFEIGTQFGISRLSPSGDDALFTTSLSYARLPSGTFLDIGSTPTSLYVTWFPNKRFAIGPEFSFGRTSVSVTFLDETETESIIKLHLGGRAAFFLSSHSASSPYVLARFSQTTIIGEESHSFDEAESLRSFGGGVGYQWRIGSASTLRAEGLYQRLLIADEDDSINEFSLRIGIGTRFGKQ